MMSAISAQLPQALEPEHSIASDSSLPARKLAMQTPLDSAREKIAAESAFLDLGRTIYGVS